MSEKTKEALRRLLRSHIAGILTPQAYYHRVGQEIAAAHNRGEAF